MHAMYTFWQLVRTVILDMRAMKLNLCIIVQYI